MPAAHGWVLLIVPVARDFGIVMPFALLSILTHGVPIEPRYQWFTSLSTSKSLLLFGLGPGPSLGWQIEVPAPCAVPAEPITLATLQAPQKQYP